MLTRRTLLVTGTSGLLAGCSMLPGDGPASRAIEREAAAKTDEVKRPAFDYVLVDLSQPIVAVLADYGPGSFFRTFGTGRRAPPEIVVGVGDTVQVTIFESGAGGLFVPQDAGSRPGNFVQLPPQAVDQAGNIAVPYAGAILARGRTLAQIQADIERRLANRALEPQAIVALTSQNSSQVTVIGQVGAPAKINISTAGDRILDVLSRASGIINPGFEVFVTLQRNGRRETTYFLNLVKNDRENIFVQPDDIIYVFQEKRYFTAFGATGQSGQFAFEQERLNLAEAVGKAGGLLDNRADPRQTLLYRGEARERLEKMPVDLSKFPRGQRIIPTVYRANFRDPASFFVARTFFMQNQDIIYVTNADKVEIFKFLDFVTGVTGAVASVGADAVVTRNAVRILRD